MENEDNFVSQYNCLIKRIAMLASAKSHTLISIMYIIYIQTTDKCTLACCYVKALVNMR